MSARLQIDVFVDLICPWCLIGKRHLDQALAQWTESAQETPVNVTWHSVQRVPDVPEQGLDFAAFYLRRLGSAEAVQMRQAQVRAAAPRAACGHAASDRPHAGERIAVFSFRGIQSMTTSAIAAFKLRGP